MTDEIQKDLPLDVDTVDDETRKLPKSRTDVEITEQVYYGKPCYVLKDPTTLRYYRLRPPEYTIYKMLDGKVEMDEILKVLAERFPKEQYDAQAVMSFVIMLRGASLLLIGGQANTDYLLKRKEQMNRSLFKRLRTEYLFFKIPLLDPDKLLNAMHRSLGPIIYSRAMTVAVWAIMAGALYFLISNIDNLHQRQPLLSWINLLYFVPSFLLIKLIHEFGHGLTSKHFDTEVHEMGILFLVFMPCPYCDVSDSWTISEKSRRMWITAAGIVVEIVLASLATYIWAFTVPGSGINQFALNVMVTASLNTLLFNGNPLLRYDGYYFLMDMMEMPNLKQKGSSYLWYLFQKFVLGVENANEPIDTRGREPGLISYAVCSAIYRWFIMFAIVGMVWTFLDKYGWGIVGAFMAISCIFTSFCMPIVKFVKFLVGQKQRIHIHVATAVILAAIVGATVYGILLLPVEQSVEAQCVLRPADLHPVYVTQPGFIDAVEVRDGEHVSKGEVLFVLQNPELEHTVSDLRLQKEKVESELDRARNLSDTDNQKQLEIERENLEEQYLRAKRDLDKLTIKSPIDGVVQLATNQPVEHLDGAFMQLQSKLCDVFTPGKYEAVTAVEERDIELIFVGHNVEIKLWPMEDVIIETKVTVIPSAPVKQLSSPAFSTMFHGEVATTPSTEREDAVIPSNNTYEIVLPLDNVAEDINLRDGLTGRSKIIVAEQRTLGATFKRWLQRTIRQEARL